MSLPLDYNGISSCMSSAPAGTIVEVGRMACVIGNRREEQKWVWGCPQSEAYLKSLALFAIPSICRQVRSGAATLPSPWWHQKIATMQVLAIFLPENLSFSLQPFTHLEALKVLFWMFVGVFCVCDTESKEEPCKNFNLRCTLYAVFIPWSDLTWLLEPDPYGSWAFNRRSLHEKLVLFFLSKCMPLSSNKMFKRKVYQFYI